ncbi:DUF2079 domain-containing protein [Ilumatobacter sp.]|uniref:DUF2079 domain-containing protein n=1 Tax=Ilumatobacter sp. TaxID=1967498 RepID=UPI003C324AAB
MTELVEEATDPGPSDDGPRWRDRWSRITPAQIVMAAVVIGYVAYFTRRTLDIHHALGTATYDSALYDQGVWLLSRFDTPFVTLMGRNLFGDHASFILVLLVPFYWIWPSAGVLFFSQSAAIGAGAIPIFLYARKRLASEWMAVVLGTAYLIHPAVGWTNLENFHPDSYLGVFVGFAIWAALDRRWKTYAVFVVLALSVKEDASLVLVPLGIWVGLKRSWRIGLATVIGSLAFMAVAMLVVMRSLIGVPTRNGWRIPFGGPRGVIDTALTNPTDLVRHLRSDDRPWYLVQMTAPFAWMFARLPSVALISALVLFTNVLSTFWYQYQIAYHYSLIAVPALALGTVYGIGAMRETGRVGGWTIEVRSLAVGIVAITAVVTSYLWAPVPWGRTELFHGNPSNDWAVAAREIIDEVPEDAIVSAHYRITPHIAHRSEIYQFPVPFRSVLYGPNGNVEGPRIEDRAERVEYIVLPIPGTGPTTFPAEDWITVEPAFDLVDSNEYWALYRRDPDVPIPS